jgi:hypothetical protein
MKRDRTDYNAARYRSAVEHGTCARCGKEPARAGRKTCVKCAKYWRAYWAKKYRKWRRQTRCTRCAKVRQPKRSLCARCLRFDRERSKGRHVSP